MVDQILAFYHSGTFQTLVAALVASGIVSVVAQALKHKISLQSKKLISFMLLVLSFVPVALQYLVTATTQNPALLGAKTLIIVGLSTQVIYPFVLRPLTTLITDAQAERARRDSAKASDAAVDSVNVIEPSADFPA